MGKITIGPFWQQQINAAHAQFGIQPASSAHDTSVSMATARFSTTVAEAAAAYDYTAGQSGVLGAAKSYTDDVAQAERDRTVALATATRDFAVNHDSAEYSAQVGAANANYNATLAGEKATYASAAGSALATKLNIDDYAENDIRVAAANARYAWGIGDTWAAYGYSVASSLAQATLTLSQAALDKAYWLAQSTSLKTMADALADPTSDTASPWITYYAASVDAYDDWCAEAADAQETERVAVALAEGGFESDGSLNGSGAAALALATRDYDVDTTQADYDQAANLNSYQLSIAVYQATAEASLISTGANQSIYPVLETASPTISYAIAAAPSGDYSSSAYGPSFGFGWPYYGYAGWAYGYYGYGWGYGYWGAYSYYDPYYYSYLYGDPTAAGGIASSPSELSLPAGFWNIESQLISVEAANSSTRNSSAATPGHAELLDQPAPSAPPLPALPEPAAADQPPLAPPQPQSPPAPAPERPASGNGQLLTIPNLAPERTILAQMAATTAFHHPSGTMTLGGKRLDSPDSGVEAVRPRKLSPIEKLVLGTNIPLRDLERHAAAPDSGIRIIRGEVYNGMFNLWSLFGLLGAGKPAYVSDFKWANQSYKLVWGTIPRGTTEGGPVAYVVDVVSADKSDAEAAQPYFDFIRTGLWKGERAARAAIPIVGTVDKLANGEFGSAAVSGFFDAFLAVGVLRSLRGAPIRVYRVEGAPNTRLLIGEAGEVAIIDSERTLYLNFGNEARAREYLAQKLDAGLQKLGPLPEAQIKSFLVPKSFVDELRASAVMESDLAANPALKGRPLIADPTKAADQFGLRPEQIEALKRVIVLGSGRVEP